MKYVNIAGVTIHCVKTHPSNKTRMARDYFAAAQRLQYAWFQTMSADLDDALSAPIREWLDAGSREFYIYDRLLLNDLLAKMLSSEATSPSIRSLRRLPAAKSITFCFRMILHELMKISCGFWC